MTKKRQRLKRRVRQREHKLQQCNQRATPLPFDTDLYGLEEEIERLNSDAVRGDEVKAYILWIYMEILDYARTASLLMQSGSQTNTLFLVLRGMLEGLADLKNLSRDGEQALNDLKLGYGRRRLRRLEEAKRGNPILEEALADDEIDEKIRQQELTNEKLKNSGAKEKQPWERLREAGLAEEYEGWYTYFSEYGHRGLKALEATYIQTDKYGRYAFPPKTRRSWNKDETEKSFVWMTEILRQARAELIGVGMLNGE